MELSKRDERNLGNLESIIHDLRDLKTHIENLLDKLGPNEYPLITNQLDWPAILNSMAILSSDMIKINKLLRRDDKSASSYNHLKNCVFVPMSFSEDIDTNLQGLSQNRMSVFNQDLIPHILRTKLSPELEEKEKIIIKNSNTAETAKNFDKNIDQFKKAINSCIEILDSRRRDLDQSKQSTLQVTYNTQETHQLATLGQARSSQARMMPGMMRPNQPYSSAR